MDNPTTEFIVRDFYKKRLTNNADICMELFAPNAHVQLAGSPEASPIACSVRGQADVHELLAVFVEVWRWTDVELLSVIVDGNRAAVHYRLTTEFTPTAETVETEIVDLQTVENGKIVSFIEFVDTARAKSLAENAAANS